MDAADGDHLRRRTVEWTDPSAARAAVEGLSGLQIMRAIRDGTAPPPPMAALIGFCCVKAEPGEIAMALDPHEALENTIGLLHGGALATMLDTAMGAAAHTLMSAGQACVTLDLKITYLRPLTLASGRVVVTGRALNLGGRTAYVEGEARDGEGRLAAHAVGNFSIIGGGR